MILLLQKINHYTHQKRSVTLSRTLLIHTLLTLSPKTGTDSVPVLGVISPLFAYSWIDNSHYFITLARGLLSLENLSHGTNLTIFYVIVCGDLISYTCIISDIVLDHDKKVRVTGIGARKYIQRYNFR